MSVPTRILIFTGFVVGGLFFGRDVFAAGLAGRTDQAIVTGDLAAATSYAERARIFDPTYPGAAKRLNLIALRTGFDRVAVGRALAADPPAIERAPHDATLRMQFAELLFRAKRFQDSAASWQALSAEYPEVGLYRGWTAEAARIAGDCDLARATYSRMVEINPNDKRSRRMLRGMASRRVGAPC